MTTSDLPPLLPKLDEDPETWGPEHDELDIPRRELKRIIKEGNRQGEVIDIDDDTDNGVS